ncbi:site-specific integrase [Actinomadura rubrisoli]|uniref:Site-specific integrase n=1 Tax=Actinomadura rubrisoli TaxID=2530368 RepID=A0A4R4ZSZ9_9ACTN|nr:site-specific integrase [Actinomadura rubrisoli]TDD61234.1 site-specific integrase [Actinomadura rubrisoli]
MPKRANGEGSIFPYRNGYAAYVWITTPAGERRKKWVYGKTRDEVHGKYIKLLNEAKQRPIPTSLPTVAQYLTYWLDEVVKPNREPNTYSHHELMVRLHIVPGLGGKRLDKLTVRIVQKWLNELPGECQCCAQGKDAKRLPQDRDERKRQRCCAIGECCGDYPSRRTIQAARDTLRAALNHAIVEEILARNVAGLVKIPAARKRKRKATTWTVEEARRFLEHARDSGDPLYAAWVLILVVGMRKGEVFGLRWADIDFDAEELSIGWQLQRVGAQLIHKERTKTDGSTDVLPLPSLCATALRIRESQHAALQEAAGDRWSPSDLVFTTRTGRPIEPRNVNRAFESRCRAAGVKGIRVHDTRHTCGKLLAALDVHPRVAMQILRHSKISLTMEIYTEVPSEATRAALRRLGDHLRKPEEEGETPPEAAA